MKIIHLLLLPALLLASCKKETAPPYVTPPPPPPVSGNEYAGDYDGIFYQHVAGVDSNGVYKSDTTYSYTVTIIDAGPDMITIHGETDITAIPVDSFGHFEFNDFNRNIEGDFVGDSLHIFSDATGGSYEPPQWYSNTQLKFDGEKL